MAQEQILQEQVPGAHLVIQQGPLVGKRVELWKECTTLGRSRDRDIFLEDIAVHRTQASILATENGYTLRDDHGSGDSLINGVPITEQILKNGDQLIFGNTHITFFVGEYTTRPFQLPSSRGRELSIGKPPTDPQAVAIARLDFSNARSGLRRIELLSEMTIGRSRGCNIFLEDLAVSRRHATIRELPDGQYELMDNRSATGTYVNGQATKRCSLKEGDVVQIGSNQFVFRMSQS